ncbi:hypothetical protein BDZ89DRAFT_1049012 [Hymenopellis radicata]|nr:hypothetical protein BDZ89DRAFT_1049012 [Hymenopellis radicata]
MVENVYLQADALLGFVPALDACCSLLARLDAKTPEGNSLFVKLHEILAVNFRVEDAPSSDLTDVYDFLDTNYERLRAVCCSLEILYFRISTDERSGSEPILERVWPETNEHKRFIYAVDAVCFLLCGVSQMIKTLHKSTPELVLSLIYAYLPLDQSRISRFELIPAIHILICQYLTSTYREGATFDPVSLLEGAASEVAASFMSRLRCTIDNRSRIDYQTLFGSPTPVIRATNHSLDHAVTANRRDRVQPNINLFFRVERYLLSVPVVSSYQFFVFWYNPRVELVESFLQLLEERTCLKERMDHKTYDYFSFHEERFLELLIAYTLKEQCKKLFNHFCTWIKDNEKEEDFSLKFSILKLTTQRENKSPQTAITIGAPEVYEGRSFIVWQLNLPFTLHLNTWLRTVTIYGYSAIHHDTGARSGSECVLGLQNGSDEDAASLGGGRSWGPVTRNRIEAREDVLRDG